MLSGVLRKLVRLISPSVPRRRRRLAHRQATGYRPLLQQLEDRTLPALVFWINPDGGNWATPSNWSTGALPTAADDVVIDIPDADVTITHSTGGDAIRSLTSSEAFVLSGGGLVISNASVIDSTLTLSGGSLVGTAEIVVNGLLTWTAGGMAGSGRTVAAGGLAISGAAPKVLELGWSLDNAGTATWTGAGELSLRTNARLNNVAGATFDVQTDARLSSMSSTLGGPGGFANAGAFVKSSGGTTSVETLFSNTGTVEVLAGTLNLFGGGVSSGTFTAAAGTTLGFGASHALTPASQVNAAGDITFSGVTVAGAFMVGGVTRVTGGTVEFLTPVNLPSLALSGGTLGGFADVTVSGLLTWTGGAMAGPGRTVVNGGLAISGSAEKTLDGRVLDNAGAATWTGTGNVAARGGAVFNNLAGAAFDAQASASFGTLSAFGALSTFNNAGTFIKAAGAATTVLGSAFNNAGTAEVRAGTLTLAGGGTSGGAFTVAAGSMLNLGPTTPGISGSQHTLTATSSVSGEGSIGFPGSNTTVAGAFTVTGAVTVNGGSANFVNDVTLTSLALSPGNLTGTGNVTVTGSLTWTGGAMSGPGRTIAAGGLTLGGSMPRSLDGRTLDNLGVATWTGSGQITASNGAALNNAAGATFTLQTDVLFNAGAGAAPAFNNEGTFIKAAGTFGTTIAPAFNNTGTVAVQVGPLNLTGGGDSSGSFQVSAGATLGFGIPIRVSSYTLRSTSSVTGAGSVAFSSGTTTVAGTFAVSGNVLINSGTANFVTPATFSTLTLGSGALTGIGDVTVTGLLTWTGGTMSGTARTVAAGGLAISGAAAKTLDARILDNVTAATWTGTGNINAAGGAVFNNRAGALFDMQNDAVFGGSGMGLLPVFQNAGTFIKSAGSGSAGFGTAFNNTGVVEVRAGSLSLSGGGTHSGFFEVAAGAALSFSGGGRTHALGPTSTVAGAGNVSFSPGVGGGATRIAGAYTIGGTTTVNGGVADFLNPVTLTALNLSAGTLTGLSDITVTGMLNWTGGTIDGASRIRAEGGLLIGGTLNRNLGGRIFENVGTARVTATGSAATFIGSGAVFHNLPGAVFIVETDHVFAGGGSFPAFNNAGTFRLVGAGGTTTLDLPFNNSGSVEVEVGTLRLSGGGSHSGSFVVAEGAAITFGGPTGDLSPRPHILGPDSRVTGAGTVSLDSGAGFRAINVAGIYDVAGATTIAGAAVTFFGDARTGTLTASGAPLTVSASLTVTRAAVVGNVLTGAGDLIVNGLLTWGGTMSGSGRTVANGGLVISGAGTRTLNGRALDNAGTATWTGTGSIALANGAVINNLAGATFDAQNNAAIISTGSPSVFNNLGTFRKSAGTGATTVQVRFSDDGAVDVQTGTLNLTGPFTNFDAATGTLAGGSYLVAGTLQFTGANIVTNAADVTLIGPASRIINQAGADALANFAANAPGAGFTLQNGRSLTAATAFSNAGAAAIGPGSTFTAASAYVQLAGTTTLSGGTLATGIAVIAGGILSGSGTISGNLFNTGQIDVGGTGTAGTLAVTGLFSQTDDGVLNLEIGGPEPGSQFDQLQVGTTAFLGGVLNVSLLGDFFPAAGDAFPVLSFGSHGGDFTAINGLDLGGLIFFPVFDETGLTLVTTATP